MRNCLSVVTNEGRVSQAASNLRASSPEISNYTFFCTWKPFAVNHLMLMIARLSKFLKFNKP